MPTQPEGEPGCDKEPLAWSNGEKDLATDDPRSALEVFFKSCQPDEMPGEKVILTRH